jgi:hypothetical protein
MNLEIVLDTEKQNRILNKFLARVNNLPLPKNLTRLKRFSSKVKHIIIHDTNCLNHSDSMLIVDSPKTGMGSLKAANITRDNLKDLNYHFILDRIGNDVEILAGRPIHSICEHEDIDRSINDSSLHIIILSDLNVDIPKTRMYQILAYRCLAPMIRMLKIGSDPQSVIRLHSEVQTENKDNIICPGDFLVKELLIAQTRRYL